MSDTNKLFKLIWFRQKAEFLIKISLTKFLGMVTIRQNEKDHSLPNIFVILFIQFSAIEIISVFPQAQFMIRWLQWLEEKLGCPCSLVSYSHFSISRQIHYVFNMRARGRAKWRHKLCAKRMGSSNVRNDLIRLQILWNAYGMSGCRSSSFLFVKSYQQNEWKKLTN